MERQSKLLIHERRVIWNHIARQAELVVPSGTQEIELPTGFAHQHIGTGNVGAAGKIKADEGYFAASANLNAAFRLSIFQFL